MHDVAYVGPLFVPEYSGENAIEVPFDTASPSIYLTSSNCKTCDHPYYNESLCTLKEPYFNQTIGFNEQSYTV